MKIERTSHLFKSAENFEIGERRLVFNESPSEEQTQSPQERRVEESERIQRETSALLQTEAGEMAEGLKPITTYENFKSASFTSMNELFTSTGNEPYYDQIKIYWNKHTESSETKTISFKNEVYDFLPEYKIQYIPGDRPKIKLSHDKDKNNNTDAYSIELDATSSNIKAGIVDLNKHATEWVRNLALSLPDLSLQLLNGHEQTVSPDLARMGGEVYQNSQFNDSESGSTGPVYKIDSVQNLERILSNYGALANILRDKSTFDLKSDPDIIATLKKLIRNIGPYSKKIDITTILNATEICKNKLNQDLLKKSGVKEITSSKDLDKYLMWLLVEKKQNQAQGGIIQREIDTIKMITANTVKLIDTLKETKIKKDDTSHTEMLEREQEVVFTASELSGFVQVPGFPDTNGNPVYITPGGLFVNSEGIPLKTANPQLLAKILADKLSNPDKYKNLEQQAIENRNKREKLENIKQQLEKDLLLLLKDNATGKLYKPRLTIEGTKLVIYWEKENSQIPNFPAFYIENPSQNQFELKYIPTGSGIKMVACTQKNLAKKTYDELFTAINEYDRNRQYFNYQELEARGVREYRVNDEKLNSRFFNTDWARVFEDSTVYEPIARNMKILGIIDNEFLAGEELAKIVKDWFNDRVSLGDILKRCPGWERVRDGRDEGINFAEIFEQTRLDAFDIQRTPDERKASLQKLQQLYIMYTAGIKILELLQKANSEGARREAYQDTYETIMGSAPVTTEGEVTEPLTTFDINSLSAIRTAEEPSSENTNLPEEANRYKLGINSPYYNSKLKEIFGEGKEKEALKVILSLYNIGELIQGGFVKKVKGQKNSLVLLNLPETFFEHQDKIKTYYAQCMALNETEEDKKKRLESQDNLNVLLKTQQGYETQMYRLISKIYEDFEERNHDGNGPAQANWFDRFWGRIFQGVNHEGANEDFFHTRSTMVGEDRTWFRRREREVYRNDVNRSVMAMTRELLGRAKITVYDEEAHAERTFILHEFVNGQKIYNTKKDGIKDFMEFLVRRGIKEKERFENLQAIQNEEFSQTAKLKLEENGAETDLAKFIKSSESNPEKLKELWEKVKGYERVNQALKTPPFSIDEKEIPAKIKEFLNKHADGTVKTEDIVNHFLAKTLEEKIKTVYDKEDITDGKINSFEDLKNEYEYLKKLLKKEKNEDKKKEYQNALQNVLGYATYASLLVRDLEKLGTKLIKFDDLGLASSGDFFAFTNSMMNNTEALRSFALGEEDERDTVLSRQELEQASLRQVEFSQNEQIREIQKFLLRDGRIKRDQLADIEQRLLNADESELQFSRENAQKFAARSDLAAIFGVGVDLNTNQVGVGMGVPIQLTDDIALLPMAAMSGAGVGLNYRLMKSKNGSFTVDISAMEFLSWSGRPYTGITLTPGFQVPDSHFSMKIPVGAFLSPSGVGVGAGAMVQWRDHDRRIIEIYRENRSNFFQEIDRIDDPREKVKALIELTKKNPNAIPGFTDTIQLLRDQGYEGQFLDNEVLKLYNRLRNLNMIGAIGSEGREFAGIVSGMGIMVIANTDSTFDISGGIGIRIGGYLYTVPSRNPSYEGTNHYSKDQVMALLQQHQPTEANGGVTVISAPGIFRSGNGEWSVVNQGTNLQQHSTLARLNAALESIQIHADKEKMGEQSVLELEIGNTEYKNINLYVDVRSGIRFSLRGNSIFLIGNSETINKLRVARSTVQLPAEVRVGGATAVDTIIISDNDTFNPDEVISLSKNKAVKKWMDGPREWRIERGSGEIETSTDQYVEFRDEILGMDSTEAISANQEMLAALNAQTQQELNDEALPEPPSSLEEMADFIFKKLNSEMRSGQTVSRPSEALFALFDGATMFPRMKQILEANPKYKDIKLNGATLNALQAMVMDKYYINIWETQGIRGVKKAFEANHSYIRKALKRFFMKNGTTTEAEAQEMSDHIENKYKTDFYAKLDEVGDVEGFKKLIQRFSTNSTYADHRAYNSTNLRDLNHEDAFAETTNVFNLPEGIAPTMGLLGFSIQDINPRFDETLSEPQDHEKLLERKIYLALTNSLLVTPNQAPTEEKKVEAFNGAFCTKLAGFIGTMLELGAKDYSKLAKFYKMSKAEQIKALGDPEYKGTLQKFEDFALKAKTSLTDGTNKFTTTDKKFTFVSKLSLASALYGTCSNTTFLANEDFYVVVENPIEAAQVHALTGGTPIESQIINMIGGVAVKTKAPDEGDDDDDHGDDDDDETPDDDDDDTPGDGKDGLTDVDGDGEGELNTYDPDANQPNTDDL